MSNAHWFSGSWDRLRYVVHYWSLNKKKFTGKNVIMHRMWHIHTKAMNKCKHYCMVNTVIAIDSTYIAQLISMKYFTSINHFSTTGRCSGPSHYDLSIRQAARAAFVMSSFKIFLTQTFRDVEPRVIYCLRGRWLSCSMVSILCTAQRKFINILQ